MRGRFEKCASSIGGNTTMFEVDKGVCTTKCSFSGGAVQTAPYTLQDSDDELAQICKDLRVRYVVFLPETVNVLDVYFNYFNECEYLCDTEVDGQTVLVLA